MAGHIPLAADATLRSVTATLDNKAHFIKKAFDVIAHHEREQGPVVLRLGVSRQSKGKRPNYCIDRAAKGGHAAVHIAVINGNTHKPWPDNDINLSGDWSTKSMTYAEMAELQQEVRN